MNIMSKSINITKNFWMLIVLLSLISFQSAASQVKLKMPNGLIANAAYSKGDMDKPAVFILHGFLQTHNFSTVKRLAENISAEGYTVFSPTMTLGIPDRKQSLACEALHDHTIEGDQIEIGTWIKWLKKLGHKKIILIGHSQGSVSILSYLTKNKDRSIKKFIAVSIVEVTISKNTDESNKLIKDLKKMVSENSRKPLIKKLSFCATYLGTPQSLLSHQRWTGKRIIKNIERIKLPIKIILGGSDNKLVKNWIDRVKKTGRPTKVITGANHFMDGVNEFDLLEYVLFELKK